MTRHRCRHGRWRIRLLVAVVGLATVVGQCAGPELLHESQDIQAVSR